MPSRQVTRNILDRTISFCSSLGTALALVAVPVYSQQQSPMVGLDSPLLNEILVTRSRRTRIGPGSEQNLVNIGPFSQHQGKQCGRFTRRQPQTGGQLWSGNI
jgi:hypothetical protein